MRGNMNPMSERLRRQYAEMEEQFGHILLVDNKSWRCSWNDGRDTIEVRFTFQASFPHTQPIVQMRGGSYQNRISEYVRMPIKGYLPKHSLLQIIKALQTSLKRVARDRRELIVDLTQSLDQTKQEVRIEMTPDFLQIKLTTDRQILLTISNNRFTLYPGIANVGNSCFANAVLQLLCHRKFLRNLIIADSSDNRRIGALSHLFSALTNSTATFTNMEVMKDIEGNFRVGREQRDAYEFLLDLLGVLVKDSLFGNALRTLVEISYTEHLQCHGCGKKQQELRSCLVFDINGVERFKEVQLALDAIGDGQCLCKGKLSITKTYTSSPEYLLIHPNWPEPVPSIWGLFSSRQQRTMMPNRWLMFNGKRYQLRGLVKHVGDTGSGHYTYFQKEGEEWVEYNDSSVHRGSNRYEGRFILVAYEKETATTSLVTQVQQCKLEEVCTRLSMSSLPNMKSTKQAPSNPQQVPPQFTQAIQLSSIPPQSQYPPSPPRMQPVTYHHQQVSYLVGSQPNKTPPSPVLKKKANRKNDCCLLPEIWGRRKEKAPQIVASLRSQQSPIIVSPILAAGRMVIRPR